MNIEASDLGGGHADNEFRDATLILVGHGSTLNAESSEPTHRHAEALRRQQRFADVMVCFWKEQPVVSAILRGVFTPRIFIVPLFISDGYFTEEVIPRELGFCRNGESEWARVQRRNQQILHYCGPVGPHPSMTEAILARAVDIVSMNPSHQDPVPSPDPVDCSLFIAGHGTGNNENSRKAIDAQVERIAARGIYRDVHAVFMEETPRIESANELAATDNLVIVPFFIADGLHSYEDIPVLLGESIEKVRLRLARGEPPWVNPSVRRGKRVWYSRSIGDEPHLPAVIIERVREMVHASP